MEYRQLGTSDLRVSEISFGSMSLKQGQETNEQIIHEATEKGMNFFDTADLYDKGENEVVLGKALRDRRKHVMISTKVGNQWNTDGSGWGWNPTKSYILSAVDESLKRLQTDYIDLYQLHGGTIEDPIDETIEAFESLQQSGKIRYYGISSIRPEVIREYVHRSSIVSVMMQYSVLDRRPEEACLQFLSEKKVGVLARGALAKGLLVNKPETAFLKYNEMEVKAAADTIKQVSGILRSPTQTALRFVLSHPAITSAVVGIRTLDQLKEAVATSSTPLLSLTEMESLRKSIPVHWYDQYR